jgi:hypothetical protein
MPASPARRFVCFIPAIRADVHDRERLGSLFDAFLTPEGLSFTITAGVFGSAAWRAVTSGDILADMQLRHG